MQELPCVAIGENNGTLIENLSQRKNLLETTLLLHILYLCFSEIALDWWQNTTLENSSLASVSG